MVELAKHFELSKSVCSQLLLPEEPLLLFTSRLCTRSLNLCFTRRASLGCRTFPWKSNILEYPSAPILLRLFSRHHSSDSRSKSKPIAVLLASVRIHSVLPREQTRSRAIHVFHTKPKTSHLLWSTFDRKQSSPKSNYSDSVIAYKNVCTKMQISGNHPLLKGL